MELILNNNIFQFHDSYWKQEVEAALGGRPIPGYANIRIAEFDEEIIKIGKSYSLDKKRSHTFSETIFG